MLWKRMVVEQVVGAKMEKIELQRSIEPVSFLLTYFYDKKDLGNWIWVRLLKFNR